MEKDQLITLVKKSQSGDAEAIEKLLQYAHTSVSYQCRKMLKNEQDAEDMTQEVLVTIYAKLDTLQEPAAFRKWANQITASRCINALNRTHVEYQFAEDEEGHSILDNLEELDEQVIPDKAIDNAETARMIEEIVTDLPDAQRAATLMFYYDEMSVKEIAKTMKVSENTVKSRLNYARKAIKEKVLDYEKQGVKLYGLSPLPFLLYFLRLAANLQEDEQAAGIMVAEIIAAEGAAAGIAGASAVAAGGTAAAVGTGAVTAGAASTAAGSTAAAGIFVGLSAKAVAGILAAVVTLGSITAVAILHIQERTESPDAAVATFTPESGDIWENETAAEAEGSEAAVFTDPSEPEATEPVTEAPTVPRETESSDAVTEPTAAVPTEAATEPTEPEVTTAPTENTGPSGESSENSCPSCGIGIIEMVMLSEPTCTSRGEAAGQCDNCGYISGYSYPPANGHTYGVTEDGQYEVCTVCGEILGPTDIGHGGVTVETEHVHSYDSVVTAPTCTAGGYTTYTCACGDSYTGDETAATGHSMIETERVDSTCEATGYYVMTCSVCGHAETTEIPMHKYVLDSESSTPEDASNSCVDALIIWNCTVCGYLEYEIIPGKGHNYKDNNFVCPCGPYAYIDHICIDCGHVSREHIEATYPEHNYVAVEGYENGNVQCTQCGKVAIGNPS